MAHKGDVFEGKNLDAAVTKGLETLGLSRAEVMITILEEGSGGFLGIGARPYRVRMMRRPGGAPLADTDDRGGRGSGRGRRDRERGAGGGRQGEGSRGSGEQRDRPRERGEERKRGEPRSERPTGRGEPRSERPVERDEWRPERPAEREERRPERPAPPEAQSSRVEAGGADDPDGGDGRGRRRRGRRGGRRRHGEPGEEGNAAAVQPRESPAERGPAREELQAERAPVHAEPPVEREFRDEPPAVRAEAPQRIEPPVRRESRERPARDYPREPRSEEFDGPGLSADELIAQSTRLTDDFLKAMGFEAKISATVDGNHVDVTAEVATDEELLTGRKGEVRQALQHLLNRILNRGEISRYHLQLEINDFWKRREEELCNLARALADEAVAAGGEVMTEYLNAQERRIVHVTLREDARVKTYALGTDMIKRVAIAPADFEGGPRDERD
jgi:spoIIIJ-associated protein